MDRACTCFYVGDNCCAHPVEFRPLSRPIRSRRSSSLRHPTGSTVRPSFDLTTTELDRGSPTQRLTSTMSSSLALSPTAQPGVFLTSDGQKVSPPPGWECLPPGDAGLTRRVKQAGPSWTVTEKKGRKVFSLGVWAPAANIQAARAALEAERSTDAYAKRKQSDSDRRERAQTEYVQSFGSAVYHYLAFAPHYHELAKELALRVTIHATPVGSGTVARTKQLPIEDRARAAVIAWMRHQTTAYDQLHIPRVKGMRREVRRNLAQESQSILQAHRRNERHSVESCPLCRTLSAEEHSASR